MARSDFQVTAMPSRRGFIAGAVGIGMGAAAMGRCFLDSSMAQEADASPSPANCLDVTEFGAKGNGDGDDSRAVQAAVDEASAAGAAVYCPPGEYPLSINILDNVQVLCGHGTIFRAVGPNSIARLVGRNAGLWNAEVVGSRQADPGSGLAAHCIEVRGANVYLEKVRARGSRYDSLYVRAGNGVTVRDCHFGPSARNTCSIVRGSDIWFERCEFVQDASVRSARHNGLYLYDIEPEGSNRVSRVTHLRCTFETGLQSGYAGVILDADGNGESGDNEISFHHCRFGNGERRAPSIRLRGGRVFRGLTLIKNVFEGMVFTNDRRIILSDSVLVSNQHASNRFSYNVVLDRVVVVGHRGAGFRGFNSTDAAVIVPAGRVRARGANQPPALNK